MKDFHSLPKNVKEKFYHILNKISIKTQLIALVSIIFSIIIVSIIAYNDHANRNAASTQQIQSSTTLLNLETQNLNSYFSEISRYSLLLRHDEAFMQSIKSSTPLTYLEKNNIQTLLRSNFDSRNDLASYRLFLLKKPENYSIDSSAHTVQPFYENDITALPHYEEFTQKPYYSSIEPTENNQTFLTYYRTIIRIEDQKPLAIVELTFDNSYIQEIAQNHAALDELFCIIDDQNQILYTNNPLLDNSLIEKGLSAVSDHNENYFKISIQNQDYLGVFQKSENHPFTIMSFKPLSILDKELAATRNISLVLAIISIVIAVFLVSFFIRLVTNPLSTLAHQLQNVGSGNFTATTDIGGSQEIKNLSTNFNSMIHHIDQLIKKNYISEINEKTARLSALEAQLNPHFLYNILQLIAGEAIINKQPKINTMVTSVASMLRYSIKEDDFVYLSHELKHVEDYLTLQQSRLGNRLEYEWNIDEDCLNIQIPKISIQTLIENSISHGMSDDVDHISIYIRAYIDENKLLIKVRDNGIGIPYPKLKELNELFAQNTYHHEETIGIGLSNLNSRLHLLYDKPASLFIESNPGFYTMVTLSIPMETCVTMHTSK